MSDREPQSDGDVLIAAAAYAVRRHLAAHPAMASQREDFFGDACVGAAAAYSRYDPAGGAGLFTYALKRAAGAITDGIRLRSPLTRGEYDRHPDPRTLMAARNPTSIELLAETGWEATSPEDRFEDVDDREHVLCLLQRCTPTEQLLLVAVVMYGFAQGEVARWLGLTESRASQILHRALGRLRSTVPA